MRIDMNANALTPEQQERFEALCKTKITFTVEMGTALVTEGLLRDLVNKFIADCLSAKAAGEEDKASILGTMGAELCDMGAALHNAVHSTKEFAEVKSLAEANDEQRRERKGEAEPTLLDKLIASRGTLQ